MRKMVCHFLGSDPEAVLKVLHAQGATWVSPSLGGVVAFSAIGDDETNTLTSDETDGYVLLGRGGAVLWLAGERSGYASVDKEGRLELALDGWSHDEVQRLVAEAEGAGLWIELRHEEDPPP